MSRAVVAQYMTSPLSAPRKTKTPKPIKTQLCRTDNVDETTKYAEVHNDGHADRRTSYGLNCRLAELFPGVLLGTGTSDAVRSSPTSNTSIDSLGQGSAFWGIINTSHPMGVTPQKPLILGTAMGISSFNVNGERATRKISQEHS
jgi:hypothetical protein